MNTQRIPAKEVLRNVWVAIAITTAILAGIAITACRQAGNVSKAQNTNGSSYAEDRALIEDLQARYMFALDFGDLDRYVATFTEDGILDIGEGEWRGRDSIKHILASMPEREDPPSEPGTPELHPSTGRHSITNIVLKIEGDTVYGRAYWFHMSNDNPQCSAKLNSYGHYEDVIVKVDGKWFFSKRKIYNEQVPRWAASANNPCW